MLCNTRMITYISFRKKVFRVGKASPYPGAQGVAEKGKARVLSLSLPSPPLCAVVLHGHRVRVRVRVDSARVR